jgi:exodeoxyribonuclease VII large subunit
VTLYEARGDVQLVVEDLEAEGEGLQRLELEALKRRLSEEGLFAAERKRALPELPGAVGVVTSATGAALQDILQVMGRRAPGVNVFLAASRVQGEGAAAELCAALQMVGEHPAVEVVILGRGGGGAEDLGAFNDEGLVRAVAACPKPVVSAVGHEIDLTLCDLAADLRAPTPSAAAELAVGEWRAWGDRVARSGRSLVAAYSHRLTRLRNLLERHDPGFRSQRPRLQRLSVAVDRAQEALTANALRRCHRARTGLSRLETRLARGAPEQRLRERRAHLLHLDQRLHGAAGRAVAAGRHQLQRRRGELGALSPLAVLERGYAVVRNTAGAVVRDAATVLPGSRVEVRLAMGELGCTVDTVRTGEAAGDE